MKQCASTPWHAARATYERARTEARIAYREWELTDHGGDKAAEEKAEKRHARKEDHVIKAFHQLCATPAPDLKAVALKLRLTMGEWDVDGHPAEAIEHVIADLERLAV